MWHREEHQGEHSLTSSQDGVRAGERRARRGQVWPPVFANFKRSEVNGIWVLFLGSIVVLFCVFRQCAVEPHTISSQSQNKREVGVQPRAYRKREKT